jgi:predicted O-methyltransferase YrrM
MDGLYHPALTAYLEGLVERPHPLLLEMEQRAAETNFPIVGPVVGQLFYWLTVMGQHIVDSWNAMTRPF